MSVVGNVTYDATESEHCVLFHDGIVVGINICIFISGKSFPRFSAVGFIYFIYFIFYINLPSEAGAHLKRMGGEARCLLEKENYYYT